MFYAFRPILRANTDRVVRRLSVVSTSQQLPYSKKVAYDYGPLKHTTVVQNTLKSIVQSGDIVIDATCGNGKDSLFLAKLTLSEGLGQLYCIDIQKDAIDNTKKVFSISDKFSPFIENGQIKFICASHETFPSEITTESVAAICYNLGYLPGKKRNIVSSEDSNESIADSGTIQTLPESTIKSLIAAQNLIQEGGMLSITAYPMHKGGDVETAAVRAVMAALDPDVWRVYVHESLNRPKSPVVFNAFKINKFTNKW